MLGEVTNLLEPSAVGQSLAGPNSHAQPVVPGLAILSACSAE